MGSTISSKEWPGIHEEPRIYYPCSQNLAQCTIEDKRLVLDTLDIKVIATPQRIEIKGAVR